MGFFLLLLFVGLENDKRGKVRHSSCTKIEYQAKVADLCSGSKALTNKLIKEKFKEIIKKGNFCTPSELYISIAMNIENILCKNFKSLKDLRAIFRTNEDCIKFLEELIWEGEPVSPYDKTSKVYKCKDGWYKCKNTGKEFNILTGTLFQGTKIDLTIWFEIIFRENSNRRGLASTTVSREYGITQTAAWHILQKIRAAMGKENHQQLKGIVEMDEYHEGGSHKNMHYDKKKVAKAKPYNGKKLLQGFSERGGNAVIRTITDTTESTLSAGILRYVELGSILYSDDNQSFNKLPPFYKRGIVVHSKKIYVSKENKNIYTNSVESLWAVFERTKEIHIHVSQKHLQNYANEAVFRYNTRKMKSSEACIWLLQNIQDTHHTWKDIKDGKYRQYNRNQERAA